MMESTQQKGIMGNDPTQVSESVQSRKHKILDDFIAGLDIIASMLFGFETRYPELATSREKASLRGEVVWHGTDWEIYGRISQSGCIPSCGRIKYWNAVERFKLFRRQNTAFEYESSDHGSLSPSGALQAAAWSERHQTRHTVEESHCGAHICRLGRRPTRIYGDRPGSTLWR